MAPGTPKVSGALFQAMRKPRHTNLVIVVSIAAIALALVGYAAIIWNWVASPASSSPPLMAPPNSPKVPPELVAARASLRENFLDAKSHLNLSQALYRAGRPVDAFYVMFAARSFFGDADFSRAHAFIALYGGRHFLDGQAYDPSPANEKKQMARLQEDPANPDALNYLAHIDADRGDVKGALELIDRGLSSHPDDAGLLAARAEWTAASLRDIPASVSFYARLAAAHPDTYEGRSAVDELGRLAQSREGGAAGENAAFAREALEELRQKNMDDPHLFSALAMAAWGRGDTASVQALIAQAEKRGGKNAGVSQIKGAFALAEHDPEKAVVYLTQAWENNPNDLYSAGKLAQLYMKQRADPEAALPYYIALYRQNPRYDDGEPVEDRIRRILDTRREEVLRDVFVGGIGHFLSSDDASLRAEACVKAARTQDPRWIDTVAELLDDDTEIVRHNADYALFQIARKEPDAVLARRMEWLQSTKPFVRIRSLNLFADLDPANTLPMAARALYDPNPAVRFMAKVMVLDHYYPALPQAAKIRADFLSAEKDPLVLGMLAAVNRAQKIQDPRPPRARVRR